MKFLKKLKFIRISWIHILIIFLSLIIFQVFVSHLQQNTLRSLLSDTMDWYKQNSAEQIGNLTTTSLELIVESEPKNNGMNDSGRERKLIHALNSVLKQPLMKRNVESMCVIMPYKNRYIAMDLGSSLYSFYFNGEVQQPEVNSAYTDAVARYAEIHDGMMKSEMTTSFQEEENVFYVYVPLVPYGEYRGAVYLKIHPDVSFISEQILSSFNKTVLIFSSLIIMGFLGMFYISTYTVIERDEAREELYQEHESHLQEQVEQRKENLFTKRIYHTHHKAEKIMGFINEDLDAVDESNIKEIKYRISKYANFISRVIYDMKWYDPPIQTIRGAIFRTDLNELLQFIIDNIFLRISLPVKTIDFKLNLDPDFPIVSVNEFVVWEIIEPLIQNCIDHCDKSIVEVIISTKHDKTTHSSVVLIEDNGGGIRADLLERSESGIKRIFLENITTKEEENNCGYGCYLAYVISKRCGWEIDAGNIESGGARFELKINS